MFTQHYLIAGQHLGSAPRKAERKGTLVCAPSSLTYFCQHCGVTYAMMPVVSVAGKVSPWHSHRGTCRNCEPRWPDSVLDVPGSIWQGWDKDFTEALPLPVLQYEFERQLENWEKKNGYA